MPTIIRSIECKQEVVVLAKDDCNRAQSPTVILIAHFMFPSKKNDIQHQFGSAWLLVSDSRRDPQIDDIQWEQWEACFLQREATTRDGGSATLHRKSHFSFSSFASPPSDQRNICKHSHFSPLSFYIFLHKQTPGIITQHELIISTFIIQCNG